jgi:hypothetical protein
MTGPEIRAPRDSEAWAKPVDRLATTAAGASSDTVTGKRVSGPLQGFGQLWQKTFSIRVPADEHPPEEVVAFWKERFPTFWPKGARFYAPLSGIKPGEVALLEVPPVPGSPVKMSTGVMVIYADRESFTFMTPEGHSLSAWITFSAHRDGDETVAQAQALERTADPLIELTYLFGANRANDRFWEQTLANLARSLGAVDPSVETVRVCVDRHRQWRHVRNVRYSPAVHMAVSTVTAPARWLRRGRSAPG